MVMMSFFLFQIASATANQIKNKQTSLVVVDIETPRPTLILLVVGHRENPEYWKSCLENIPVSTLDFVYIVIDGLEKEDEPMFDEAMRWKEKNNNHEDRIRIYKVSHRGKRGVMAYGFQKIRYDHFHIAENWIDVAVSDSDTILDPKALIELQRCLRSDSRNGCVTGTLGIFNQETLLARLVNWRYNFAFNIERASASYFGCMTCCSGPLSMYRLNILTDLVLQRFVTQSICGVKCEPGDDRHLTNLVMAQGWKSKHTNLAFALTESPETLMRYILQQLRWNRSFYRELKWQIACMRSQSFYLTFLCVYELFFPGFVLCWTLRVLFTSNPNLLLELILVSLGVVVLRNICLSFYFWNCTLFYGLCYYILYIFILLPLKIFALFTVLNNSWVTPSRNKIFPWKLSWDACLALFTIASWDVCLLYGVVKIILAKFL